MIEWLQTVELWLQTYIGAVTLLLLLLMSIGYAAVQAVVADKEIKELNKRLREENETHVGEYSDCIE